MTAVTVYIAGRGTSLAEGGSSRAGHIWYVLVGAGGQTASYGFAPAQHGESSGPGRVYSNDNTNYQSYEYAKTIDITQAQYDNIKSFSDNPGAFGFGMNYSGLSNSCVDFAWKAMEVGGLNPTKFQGNVWPTWNGDNFDDVFTPSNSSPEYFENYIDNVGDWFSDSAEDFQAAIASALRRLIDPIIVDLDGDGIELSPRAGFNVVFDMDGDGLAEWTGWIGKDDAFLVIDANVNGKIDSIDELVGDQNRSGFAELVTYDGNGDQILNASDSTWLKFRLWRDVNSNGTTESGELLTLAQGGIKSIDLHYTTVSFSAAGSQIHETSVFEKTAGGVGTLVDAWLDVDNVAQALGVITTGNITVDALPNLRNYGDLSTLREAMLTDGALTTSVNTVVNLQPYQLAGVRGQIEQVLFRWAETNSIAGDSRGSNFDGRMLATLEKVLGTPYLVNGQSNPTPAAVINLTLAWNRVVDGVESRLLLAGVFKGLLPTTVYDGGADRFITFGTIEDVISGVRSGQPTTDTLARANYWSAAITVINRLAEDGGIDTASQEHRSKVDVALGEIGFGSFQDSLHSGIAAAVLPASGILNKSGIYRLSDAAETAYLVGDSQAVFALGGNDRLVATNMSGYDSAMLDGGTGDDTLEGSDGADWLDGGAGTDFMIGLGGDDTYLVDHAGDLV
ncbi:MAG TPA: hypothetical protein PL117_11490, partial [Accumulibacter sp.]|nr:hypothetical protein [Accumulibacter sp.]